MSFLPDHLGGLGSGYNQKNSSSSGILVGPTTLCNIWSILGRG